ncbi:uncharacterized protein LOC117565531 [Drosophila albomicans]|uniref:Uncharacterized protein LOC117565531 n=1 Tax=Drosophila albomicans TaxID=7291 RepID=A0A6P8WMN5_DROAB|nr:uncharacterized protein LOC117565531 [Drosophila albomicans]
MEHHTYAKSGSKKWSAEEKRLLVTKRIEAEDLFSKYSSKQAEPWKKFKDMVRIGDYSERALRKQWLNMVQRYRIQKANMQVTPLNQQCIELLNEEWEFFGQIHAYMTQRTTDLHSYALKEPNVDASNNYNNIVAMRGLVNDHDCLAIKAAAVMQRHPLLRLPKLAEPTAEHQQQAATSNKLSIAEEQPIIKAEHIVYDDDFNALDDAFTDSLDSLATTSEPSDPVAIEVSDLSETDSIATSLKHESTTELPAAEPVATERIATAPRKERGANHRKRKALTEREKYYRHRRRYDHRMELRLSAVCAVAGQLLERLVPDINVTPLLINIDNNEEFKCNSSCDDDDDDDDEEENNVKEEVDDQ